MEPETIRITEAHYTTGYQIEMTFNDSSKQTINFEPYLIRSHVSNINKYLDKGKFTKFLLVDGNLLWKNIEMTFPIASLHAGKI